MELWIYFKHSISYILVFAIIPICKANYDAQLAIKMKEMDMEYGEKLTSLEEGQSSTSKGTRTNHERNSVEKQGLTQTTSRQKNTPLINTEMKHPGSVMLKAFTKLRLTGSIPAEHLQEIHSDHTQGTRDGNKKSTRSSSVRSTRCTTSKPLPKLSPWFLPNENEGNDISTDEEKADGKTKNTYLAPKVVDHPKHYIDDE